MVLSIIFLTSICDILLSIRIFLSIVRMDLFPCILMQQPTGTYIQDFHCKHEDGKTEIIIKIT